MPNTIGAIELTSDWAVSDGWQRLVRASNSRRPLVDGPETVLIADLSELKRDLRKAYSELRQQLDQR